MTAEELAAAWDLWFDLAQATNANDPAYTHGVFVGGARTAGRAFVDDEVPRGSAGLPPERRVCAALLYRLMSELSEERWCAGWLIDLEFEVWDALHGATGWRLTAAESEQLRYLSDTCGGWIVWDHGPRLVTLTEWRQRVRRRTTETAKNLNHEHEAHDE